MKKIIVTCIIALVFVSGCALKEAQLNETSPVVPAPANVSPASVSPPNHVVKSTASVYSDTFQGKKTAHGDLFDQGKATAASKTLPLGSKAKVTNKKTGKSVTVTINDRGPFVRGRAIDLSKAAARGIGMDTKGVAEVTIEKVR